jgi:FkbM family methyltransferase
VASDVVKKHGIASFVGGLIGRSLQANLSARFVPLPIKLVLWKLLWTLLNIRMLREYSPVLSCHYGFRLHGAVADSTLNKVIFYRGLFEPTLSEVIVRHVKPGDLCVDLGANTGYFTLLMAKTVGEASGGVIAIEAAPGNVRRLMRNLEINGFSDRVEVQEVACGDTSGQTTFYVNEDNDMHSRLALPSRSDPDYWLMSRRWKPVTVRLATLAEVVGDRAADVSFVKIDIEGAEHLIVNTLVELFRHPKLIVAIEAKQPHVMETLKPFEENGFFVYDLRNSYRWIVDRHVESGRPVSFADLYAMRRMVDVVLSRQPLDIGTGIRRS